jgi:hypothetical protein
MMKADKTSETSVNFYKTTRRNIAEESYLQQEMIFGLFAVKYKIVNLSLYSIVDSALSVNKYVTQ